MAVMRTPDHPASAWAETPVGEMLIVTTRHGVLRTRFSAPDGSDAPDEDALLEELAGYLGEPPEQESPGLAWLVQQVQEWFDGGRLEFEVGIDLGMCNDFQRDVYRVIAEIPFGETMSYGEVAAMAGSPRAARAVGTACRDIPVSLFLPVHRVIRADGTTGESPNSPCMRRTLLAHERAVLGHGPSPWK